MSLLWPDVRVAVLPGRVAVVSGRGATELPVPAESALAATLAEALEKAHCKGTAEIVLSHALAPVWLLQPPAVRLNWNETQGWVREQMATYLGERVAQYRLAFEPSPPGEPVLVSALEASWMAELLAVLARHGVKAKSIRPWLAAAGYRNRARLKQGSSWLALAEPDRLTLAYFNAGRMLSVRSQQVATDMATALRDAVKREALLAGETDKSPVWLESCCVQAPWRELAGQIEARPVVSGDIGAAMLVRT